MSWVDVIEKHEKVRESGMPDGQAKAIRGLLDALIFSEIDIIRNDFKRDITSLKEDIARLEKCLK